MELKTNKHDDMYFQKNRLESLDSALLTCYYTENY